MHTGPKVIRNLYYRTTLNKVKVLNKQELYITYKLAKLQKKISKELLPQKETILVLIYANVVRPFYTSL